MNNRPALSRCFLLPVTLAALVLTPSVFAAKSVNPASKIYVADLTGESQVDTGERIEVALQPDSAAPELVKAAIERDHRVARVAQQPESPQSLFVDLVPGEHGHHFLIESVIAAGGKLAAFRPVEIKLEDAFLKLTTGALQ